MRAGDEHRVTRRNNALGRIVSTLEVMQGGFVVSSVDVA